MTRRPPLAAAALLLLPPAIWACQRQIDARLGDERHRIEPLLVWSGEAIRRASPGLEQVLADVYWLRAVQYYGGERAFNPESRFELLEPLIRTTVSLDPRFLLAYRYGAIFLAERWPSGAGRPAAAAALLERGIEANPESWELRWDLGTVRFLYERDSVAAAEVLREGADLPGAPVWLDTLAGRMLSDANERDTARMIWSELYRQNEGAIRENARTNLQYLDAVDALDALRARLRDFHERTGRWPPQLAAVQGRGAAALPLADPQGTPFRYDSEDGTVSIHPDSLLWTLVPEDQRRPQP